MSECIVENLCLLVDDPDDLEIQDQVLDGYEGSYCSDDVSQTEHFTCREVGCSALLAYTSWFEEFDDTDNGEGGVSVKLVSGNCIADNSHKLPKIKH
jgi:hypothetical protein